MNTLFELPEEEHVREKCKTCDHFDWLEFGKKKIFYCNIHKSNRTQNGKLKIKANQIACPQYIPRIEMF